MIEFTFGVIIALVMLFSVMMIFRWAGYDFGWRRVDHDLKISNVVKEDFAVGSCLKTSTKSATGCARFHVVEGPLEQIDPYFHKPAKMGSAWGL